MNEQDIIHYLENHPDFFTRHPSLLKNLTFHHSQKGAISLIEAQLMQYRQEITALTSQLEKCHQLAIQEADIFFALIPLQKKLFQAQDFLSIEKKLDQWAKSYELEGAKILLFTDSWQKTANIPSYNWIDRKAFDIIRLERFGLRQFYLGDLSGKEKSLIFLPEELPIGSVACCLLGTKDTHKPTALLLFRSRDVQRFHNGQDISFLKHLVDIVDLHLEKHLNQ
ncbi:DUF484 family protein [Rodentibacter genomosp. 1]|uniref:DUF484 family protein n=1 Tax=Rodentibacter genomosp. 1 TaxID=1908264 RepID=A0A1V3J6I3_9PAST|nr:DUF484 family protein [Rodentibacter genomosp. 1]OOF50664.1 DUF484 family protein [Rodentibacter genomosp. 1]